MRKLLALTGLTTVAGMAIAAQTIDGLNITADDWGVFSVATQDTNTRFGNNFNELCRLFIDSDSQNVYVGIPGNLTDNNALTIFIDTNGATGSAVLNTDPNGPCPGSVPTLLRHYDGSTLDFTPNFSLLMSVGIFPGQSTSQLVFAADLTNLQTLQNNSLGIGAVNSGNGLLTGNSGVQIAIDTTNTLGVGEWDPNFPTPADSGDDPNSATTGYEIAIPRSLLGLTGPSPTTVSFFAYISNNGQDFGNGACQRRAFGSNQGLPGVAGSDNLGDFDGFGTFLNFPGVPGAQVVTVNISTP
jgi:hypothetical protein